jgi:hypothetical protein
MQKYASIPECDEEIAAPLVSLVLFVVHTAAQKRLAGWRRLPPDWCFHRQPATINAQRKQTARLCLKKRRA